MIGLFPEGELVQGTVDQVVINGFSESIQLVGVQLDVLELLMDRDREGFFSRWELTLAVS